MTDQPASSKRLIFVYNADSGLFNTLTDIAHKIFSPDTYPCNLCSLTHSPFAMRGEWRDFLARLDVEYAFLHRDELQSRFPDLIVPLPAVLCETASEVSVCLDAEQIRRCDSLAALIESIATRCAA